MSRPVWVLLFGLFVVSGNVSSRAAPPNEFEMAARIDAHLAAEWSDAHVAPAPSASDAEFLRRAWLDLTGIIPPLNESVDRDGDGKADEFYGVRGFLADARPDKRQRLVNYLLSKPTHARHFSNLWKNVMLPADTNVLLFGGDNGFQGWLYGQFKDNVPYDQMVRDLLLTRSGPTLRRRERRLVARGVEIDRYVRVRQKDAASGVGGALTIESYHRDLPAGLADQ